MNQLRRIDPELHAALDAVRLALKRLRTQVGNVRAMIDTEPETAIAWGRNLLLAGLRELEQHLDETRLRVIGDGALGEFLTHEQQQGRYVGEVPNELSWWDWFD